MKIESVEFRPLVQKQDDPTWSFALATYPVIEGWIVELRAGGKTGRGYAQAIPHMGSSHAGVGGALELYRPKVVGRSAFDIEPILGGFEPVLAGNAQARAGIDGALHDLAAQLLGVPVHVLLGGAFRTHIPQIRIVPIKPPAEMAAESRRLVAKGYRALKIKLKGVVTDDVARVKAIREAVGPEVLLTLDPNQSYRAKDAIVSLQRMEPYDVRLVEQPVAAADLEGLALVTRTVPQIVEADESAVTLADVARLAGERVVDAVSLKIPKLGGLRNALLAARMCEQAGLEIRIGATFGPRLAAAQAAHLAAALPRLSLPCELAEYDHLQDDPFDGLELKEGSLAVPMEPGSGVRLRNSERRAA